VEHIQMHLAMKKGTKNFHCTSNSLGILANSLFHLTKIPTVDIKVLPYSNFRKYGKK
jgi:hypothetical protein